ncbi:acyl-coenzyme A thioesterase 1-like [Tachyglossus aculeatus]|uniref:acyl-coenzyme A thioesterase 1-like n=1 Tax=Tachyglossus aculeatus TaxID=9261 RepID=UPI0018F59CC2|nr:acyl-coenzyme A thioesterase 1-like [Tachyglossus aculeatus]
MSLLRGPRLGGLWSRPPATGASHRWSAIPGRPRASSSQAARMAVSVRVEPPGPCPWDEAVRVSVRGLGPGQAVTVRASLLDESGEPFGARGRYRADGGGRLELERAAAGPGGSFSGLEPMGLIWALRPQRPLWRLVKRDVRTPFRVELQVLDGHGPADGPVLAAALHERVFMAPGVTRIPVRQGSVRATLFLPPGPGPFPGIIDLSGAGGGLSEYRASLLAGRGFAMLALAYYNYDDLPKEMKDLHLEYFEEAVEYLRKHPQVKGPGIGLLGISKGGDLCLSMASFLKGIAATVTVNGSVANVGAALHYKGTTIPPIGFDPGRIRFTQSGLVDIVDVLNNPLEEPDTQSFIPVEKAESRFLFIVGQDDHNWKSEFLATEAAKRIQAHGKEKPQIICYPGAGHYIEPPYFPMCPASVHALVGRPVIWGGEPKAHSVAQVDAWQQIQIFFRRHLGGNPEVTPANL